MHPEGDICLVFVKESSASKPLAFTHHAQLGAAKGPQTPAFQDSNKLSVPPMLT